MVCSSAAFLAETQSVNQSLFKWRHLTTIHLMTLSKRSRSELFSLIRLFAEIQHFLREWARSDRNNCRLTGRTLEQNRARRWAAICLVPAQTEDCRFCSSFFHQSLKEGLLQGHSDFMISDVTMWVLSWDRRSATEDAYSQTFITNCDVNLCFFSHEKGEIKDYKSLMLTKMYFNLPVSVSELLFQFQERWRQFSQSETVFSCYSYHTWMHHSWGW